MTTAATPTTKAAIGYARVSTDRQADEGCSLAMQREKIAAMATVQDLDLVEIITDAGASAKTLRRPGMDRILDLVDSGSVKTVVVYKLDRLTRSVGDLARLLERFERAGVDFVSVSESLDTGTAAGRLVLNVMASVAQWEREIIAERTREALRAKAARDERVGQVPFGFRVGDDGVHLEHDDVEQEALAELVELRERGLPWSKVSRQLNARGRRTKTGREWTWQTARKIGLRAAT